MADQIVEPTLGQSSLENQIQTVRNKLHSLANTKGNQIQIDTLRAQLNELQGQHPSATPYFKGSYRDARQLSGNVSDASVKMAQDPAKNFRD